MHDVLTEANRSSSSLVLIRIHLLVFLLLRRVKNSWIVVQIKMVLLFACLLGLLRSIFWRGLVAVSRAGEHAEQLRDGLVEVVIVTRDV